MIFPTIRQISFGCLLAHPSQGEEPTTATTAQGEVPGTKVLQENECVLGTI